jgi:ABC-type multidrug transport system fused ATPase/permease subunit
MLPMCSPNFCQKPLNLFKIVSFHSRYRPHLPLALKDLSLDTKAREKVGVVGRTGSGKSSLFHVLFRTFDIDSGRVSIDGVDTKILNLVRFDPDLLPI